MKTIDVIVDTDIGDDIDDTWALAYLLAHPAFRVVHVAATTGETEYKAALVDRFLTIARNFDSTLSRGKMEFDGVHPQAPFAGGHKLSRSMEDYATGMRRALENNPEAMILLLGPCGDFSSFALTNESDVANRKIVYLAGAVRHGYLHESEPGAESNMARSKDASNALFERMNDLTLLPLDVCYDLRMEGKLYQRFVRTEKPLGKAVKENYLIWDRLYDGGAMKFDPLTTSTILYDAIVPYYLVHPNEFVVVSGKVVSTDDGCTVFFPGQGKTKVALSVASKEKVLEELCSCLS